MTTPDRSATSADLSGKSEVLDTLAGIFESYASPKTSKHASSSYSTDVHHHQIHSLGVGAGDDAKLSFSSRAVSIHEKRARQVDKIHELWREARTELQSKNREIARLKTRVMHEEEANKTRAQTVKELHSVSESNAELRDKVRFIELQLVNVNNERDALRSSYEEALQKLGEALKVLEAKGAQQRETQASLKEANDRIKELVEEKENILSRTMLNIRSYEEDGLEKERELTATTSKLVSTEQGLVRTRTERDELLNRVTELEAEVRRYEDAHASARGSLAATTEELKELRGAREGEKHFRIQVQHLKLDNARLANLLATTREYREFMNGSFAPDGATSTGRERSSYLAEVSDAEAAGMSDFLGGPAHDAVGEGPVARWDEVDAYRRHYSMEDSLEMDPSAEAEHWVPSDAVKVAVQFRQQHMAHVPSSLIRKFLSQLNKTWRQRMNAQATRIKAKYVDTIGQLKRKLEQRTPYKEVVQHSTIGRLQSDLKALRRKSSKKKTRKSKSSSMTSVQRAAFNSTLRSHSTDWCGRVGGMSTGDREVCSRVKKASSSAMMIGVPATQAELMEATLARVETLSRQLAELAEENTELRENLDALRTSSVSRADAATAGRGAYTRGIRWFGGSVIRSTDKVSSVVNDILSELQHLCSAAARGSEAMPSSRQQIELISKVNRTISQHRNNTKRAFETALATGGNVTRFQKLMVGEGPSLDDVGDGFEDISAISAVGGGMSRVGASVLARSPTRTLMPTESGRLSARAPPPPPEVTVEDVLSSSDSDEFGLKHVFGTTMTTPGAALGDDEW